MKLTLLLITLLAVLNITGQQTGYYNGTDGKSGDELKTALNDIIKGHTVYSYYSSKFVFNLSDADPNNPDNVILVYTGRSNLNNDYGTGGDFINREHVWAKSHGNFVDVLPMYSDVHNLKPADASVNVARSNKDFDDGGIQNTEATGCYYTDSTWEARDEVKGDIARIIFYMSTRYEGNDGESDLEVVDWNNTYPLPQHGKLSTLLEWNLLDPPDEFERNRNNVIFSYQHNRNPFIDNPEFAQLIWGGATVGTISFEDIQINPVIPVSNEPVEIDATITSTQGAISSAYILWGTSYDTLVNQVNMESVGDTFTGFIPGQEEGQTIYYQIIANDISGENSSIVYDFFVPKVFTGDLVSIYNVQGQQDVSPYDGQTVSISGIVTANFGTSYFVQDGTGLWNGLFIYESGRNPAIGDSVIITGEISEYYEKTEMSNISDYYFISSNHNLPEPVEIATGGAEEGHESIIVKVKDAVCTDENYQANFFMWTVNDGSGDLMIHNSSIFEYVPTEGFTYDITGPLNWDFGEWKIEIRYESDVVGSVDTDSPYVVNVEPIISTNILVQFNEGVEETTAEDITNYYIDNDIIIESASQHAFNKAQVHLTVSQMSFGNFVMTIKDVVDESGNIMVEQTMEFSYVGIDELLVVDDIEIYPNPADNQLNIAFSAKDNVDLNISLIDISGRAIMQNMYSANSGTNLIKIDINNISRGIYFLNIMENNSSLNYKVIVK
ncbi:MAG: endonuclease [Candidatus Tenebribacter mawsonii]|nr:endonuclease [Candidatus Tenebribacter mawsonii]